MNEWPTDPYRFPGLRGDAPYEEEAQAGAPADAWPGLLPEPGPLPAPARRPGAGGPDPADRRRLDLHVWLTSAGVRPHADDPHAIAVLSTVDDTTHAALRRWITGGL
ncbi:hypothetical protein ACGFY6_27060 [Streptomyces sp. NPDC048387]|uniref:hypothetical protein n=1 Tax=unclassified Streptomyces TaxID=2593676 RepID=UPI0036ADD7FE